jgi:hypothetical protein
LSIGFLTQAGDIHQKLAIMTGCAREQYLRGFVIEFSVRVRVLFQEAARRGFLTPDSVDRRIAVFLLLAPAGAAGCHGRAADVGTPVAFVGECLGSRCIRKLGLHYFGNSTNPIKDSIK